MHWLFFFVQKVGMVLISSKAMVAICFLAGCCVSMLYLLKHYKHKAANEWAGKVAALKESVKAQELLQQDNRNKQLLLSVLAHDTKTPVNFLVKTALHLYTTIKNIDTIPQKEELTEISKILYTTLHELAATYTDTLQLIKLPSMAAVKPEYFQLAECIEQVIALFSPIAAAKNIHIAYIAKGSHTPVIAKKVIIKTILSNLIDNAVKNAKQQQPHITIESHIDNEKIIINVSDNGFGMESTTIAQIKRASLHRQDFQLIDMGYIGYIIINELVALLNANLTIHSRHGQYTNISLQIPVLHA